MSEQIDRAMQIADNVIRDVDARRLHNQGYQLHVVSHATLPDVMAHDYRRRDGLW